MTTKLYKLTKVRTVKILKALVKFYNMTSDIDVQSYKKSSELVNKREKKTQKITKRLVRVKFKMEKNKQWKNEMLMETLRSKTSKTFHELAKNTRLNLLERR